MELAELKGKDLTDFRVQEFTEVYKTNDDGRKVESIAYFQDENIAKAFAQNQVDANWHRTGKALVLTDGKVGFLLGQPIRIASDEQAELEIRKKALAKLSNEERKVLGIG